MLMSVRYVVVQLVLSFHHLKHTPSSAHQRSSGLLKNAMKSTKNLMTSSSSFSAPREKKTQWFVMLLQEACAQRKSSQSAVKTVGVMKAVTVPKCCVQLKVFRCLTCDKDKVRLYCEVCWKRDHQGHKGEELFCLVRCATGHK